MFRTEGRLKSASGLYCVKFLISLPCDASAERGCEIACRPYSICPTVTIRFCDHIGWNSSKIISRPNICLLKIQFFKKKQDFVMRLAIKAQIRTWKNVKCVHMIKCVKVRTLFAKNRVRFARAEQLCFCLTQPADTPQPLSISTAMHYNLLVTNFVRPSNLA